MIPYLCALSFCLIAVPGDLQTHFVQVHPEPRVATHCERSPGQQRAVILIHGFYYTLKKEHVPRASLHDWQEPGSLVVQTLRPEADVFAFAYGQNVGLESVAQSQGLEKAVQRVRALGYREIVLVGHSAGGLVARQFVEDHPDAGVTRLVQVGSPNGGTKLATFPVVPANHKLFMESMTRQGREKSQEARKDKSLPAHLQCVSVVCCGLGTGDGVVSCNDQWPADLQRLGIPAVRLGVLHFQAMHDRKGAACILDMVTRDLPRWSEREVQEARKRFPEPRLSGK